MLCSGGGLEPRSTNAQCAPCWNSFAPVTLDQAAASQPGRRAPCGRGSPAEQERSLGSSSQDLRRSREGITNKFSEASCLGQLLNCLEERTTCGTVGPPEAQLQFLFMSRKVTASPSTLRRGGERLVCSLTARWAPGQGLQVVGISTSLCPSRLPAGPQGEGGDTRP